MKIEKTKVAAVALLGLWFAALGGAQTKADQPGSSNPGVASVPMPKTDRMPMAEFKKLLATGDVVAVDVRANADYVNGHIPGALSIPESTINQATAEKLKRMGKIVATYCS